MTNNSNSNNRRVGIFTESPDEALHVSGNIKANNILCDNLTVNNDSVSLGTTSNRVNNGFFNNINTTNASITNLINNINSQSIIPNIDNTYNLASITKRWSNIYSNKLSAGNKEDDVDPDRILTCLDASMEIGNNRWITLGKENSNGLQGEIGFKYVSNNQTLFSLGFYGQRYINMVYNNNPANRYIGIFTESPDEALHVSGNFKANNILCDNLIVNNDSVSLGTTSNRINNGFFNNIYCNKIYFNDNIYFELNSSNQIIINNTTENVNGVVLTNNLGLSLNTFFDYNDFPYYHPYTQQNFSDRITGTLLSDDRLKHNEENITNSLDVIRKLNPQTYSMTTNFYDASYTGNIDEPYIVRSGFIAQEIRTIDEISFCCVGEEYDSSNNPTPLSIDYNTIFTYGIQAIKELDITVNNQKNKIKELEEHNFELQSENLILNNELTNIKIALNKLLSLNNLNTI
jgi:hypothetical protein